MLENFSFIILVVGALSASLYTSFIKISAGRLALYTGMNIVFVFTGLVFMPFVPLPPPEVWPYLALSSFFYCASSYFICYGFKTTDLSVAAPIMGGIKALFIVLTSVSLLNETALPLEWLAISGILVGIFMQVRIKEFIQKAHVKNVMIMSVTGIFSGAQLITDIQGIRLCDNPFSYIVFLMLLGIPVLVYGLFKQGKETRRLLTEQARPILLASLFDIVSYTCVLLVLYVMKVLYAMPITHLSIVFTTLFGLIVLKEQEKPRRIVAAILITACVVLIQVAQ